MAESSSPSPRENRSTTPISEAFRDFIQTGWADFQSEPASPLPHVPLVQSRRETVSAAFPGTTLIIPAGSTKVRSNDTDYPYRPHTAFAYLTGWGSGTTPGSILLGTPEGETHQWALFVLPPAPRTSDEFYANPAIGEFWTGRRPGLDDVGVWLGLETKDLESWSLDDLDLTSSAVVASAEESLTREIRERRGTEDTGSDDRLAEVISEMRLVKDDYEVSELTEAIAATHRGFQDIIHALPDAVGDPRGERIVEGPNNVLEAPMGGGDSLSELGDLIVIFDQSHLTDDLVETVIASGVFSASALTYLAREALLGGGHYGTRGQIKVIEGPTLQILGL